MKQTEPSRPATTALEQASRPLMQLARRITSMESIYVTSIDWDRQRQETLFALNTGELQVEEGTTIDWFDSLGRNMQLAGRTHSAAIGSEVPMTSTSRALGLRSFVAVPILQGDKMIGMVCGASREPIALDDDQAEAMQLIADALQQLLEARREAAEWQRRAHTDVLTGLPNRRSFISRWEDELARSGRRSHPIGLLIIDADRFKAVNDSLGHHVGDAVLRGIGATLQDVASAGDVVARLGGDEFALATTHKTPEEVADTVSAIRARFAAVAAELGVDSTLSIGLAHSDAFPRDQLLLEADRAMYRDKIGTGLAA